MKKLKTLLTYVCVLVTLFTSISFPVYATEVDTETETETETPPISREEWLESKEEVYNRIMSSSASAYFITAQPDSAIYLQETINLQGNMLSSNYDKATVDLPRLQSRYYYKLIGSNNYRLSKGVYPSLYWSEASKGTLVTLAICSADTDQALWTCSVTNSDLEGYDFSGQWEFPDCSERMMTTFKEFNSIRYQRDTITLYPASLHSYGFIMPNYMYTLYGDDYATNANPEMVYLSEMAVDYKRLTVDDRGSTVEYNIKDYVQEYQQGESRPAVLFQGSKVDGCLYDCNTGVAKTTTTNSDVGSLYYIIALNDKAFFGDITTDIVDSSALNTVDSSQSPDSWSAGDRHSVIDMQTRGPVSYDDWYKTVHDKYSFDSMVGKYTFIHSNEEKVTNVNLYAKTLMFVGVAPHVKNLTLEKMRHTLTINYFYQDPNTGSWIEYETNDYDVDSFTSSNLAVLPELKDFTPTAWYTNRDMSELFTPASIDKTEDSVLNLYAGYTYSGGTYEVTFRNTMTNESTKATYEVRELPVLPEVEDPGNGHRFKNWELLGDGDDRTPYNPETFTPVAGRQYVLETAWDIVGVIQTVLADKTGYFVGDKIDKNHIRVVVMTDNDGTTRELDNDEYTIFPDTIEKEGKNQFFITYTETGSTATCELNGVAVAPIGISATYTGGSVVVGESLSNKLFDVTLNYNNKKTEKVNNFTINPSVITTAGDNRITISYMNFTTSVIVKGITKEQEDEQNKKLKSISADYDGNTYIYVGDKVRPEDFVVTATYTDKSKTVLGSKEFQYSPKTYKTAGVNIITITFGGKSARVKVDVRKKGDNTGSGSGGSGNNNQGGSSGGNNQGSDSGNNNNQGGNSGGNNYPGGRPSSGSSGGNSNNQGGTSSNNSNNQSGNNGSSNNQSGNNSSSGNNNNSNKTDSKDKGPSPGYLSAATILTNTMGNGSTGIANDVDIMEEINKMSPNATSLDITLVNGASGNEINSKMLEAIKNKVITLNITMVQPLDRSLVVGRWVFKGSEIDVTEHQVDPNITFEVTDKDSDRLVFMVFSNSNYPKGISVTAYPAVESYGSGELVRLYNCNVTKGDSKLIQSFTWQDISNPITADIYSELHYCLSNSANAYADGSSLADNKDDDWINVDVDDESYDDIEDDTEFDWGEGVDGTESDIINPKPSEMATTTVRKPKTLFVVVGIVAGVLLLLMIIGVIVLTVSRKGGGRSAGASESDDLFDSDSEFDDIPEVLGDVEGVDNYDNDGFNDITDVEDTLD